MERGKLVWDAVAPTARAACCGRRQYHRLACRPPRRAPARGGLPGLCGSRGGFACVSPSCSQCGPTMGSPHPRTLFGCVARESLDACSLQHLCNNRTPQSLASLQSSLLSPSRNHNYSSTSSLSLLEKGPMASLSALPSPPAPACPYPLLPFPLSLARLSSLRPQSCHVFVCLSSVSVCVYLCCVCVCVCVCALTNHAI